MGSSPTLHLNGWRAHFGKTIEFEIKLFTYYMNPRHQAQKLV